MKKLVLALMMLMLPITGFSASNEFEKCINSESYSASDGCASDENERQTKRMENAYKSALASKSVDVKKLKSAQGKWTKKLKELCPEYAATASANEEWQQCLAEKTEARAIELEKMLGK